MARSRHAAKVHYVATFVTMKCASSFVNSTSACDRTCKWMEESLTSTWLLTELITHITSGISWFTDSECDKCRTRQVIVQCHVVLHYWLFERQTGHTRGEHTPWLSFEFLQPWHVIITALSSIHFLTYLAESEQSHARRQLPWNSPHLACAHEGKRSRVKAYVHLRSWGVCLNGGRRRSPSDLNGGRRRSLSDFALCLSCVCHSPTHVTNHHGDWTTKAIFTSTSPPLLTYVNSNQLHRALQKWVCQCHVERKRSFRTNSLGNQTAYSIHSTVDFLLVTSPMWLHGGGPPCPSCAQGNWLRKLLTISGRSTMSFQ